MTTAHRPTWAPAKGGAEQGGMRMYVASRQLSAKDIASHTKMKFRVPGQSAAVDLEDRDLRSELELKELKYFRKKQGVDFEEERKKDLMLLEGSKDDAVPTKAIVPRAVDADEGDPDSDSDSDSDEDDEAELLAELARIKKEREEEAYKKAREVALVAAAEKEAELARGNPLLALAGETSFAVKRRWDDDVVFKNQSRSEAKTGKRFINDTIRSDFHKRFLFKYIK